MSKKEIDRLAIIQKVQGKQLTQVQAARQLALTTRQVRRLVKRFRRHGPEGIISKRRGKPSNNHLPEVTKAYAIELIKTYYLDFGPTLAHEKLTGQHGLKLSVESLRLLMVKEGIMRLRGISDIATANQFLPKFIEDYNKRFAVSPANPTDAHRDSVPTNDRLKLIFSQQHQRTISKNLEISYKHVIYQIQATSPCYTM